MNWGSRFAALLGLAAAFAAYQPNVAEACGGTFCDNLPQPMPIDQTGENILFVVDGPQVEAHIQINIDPATDATKFAWVIPVASIPEFSIGSDPLFNSLLAATVPQYSVNARGECGPTDPGGSTFISMPDGGSSGGFEPVFHETIGALDVAVLAGGTADEVQTWLLDNDFAQDDAAVPIIEEYTAQGWMFAAVRLANNAEIESVHPLVMRYDNGEPCVPLRLTRIAAVDDMEVRTFFLGDVRVAPSNYKHVLINPLKVDWLDRGSNYKEVVTMAVDQDGADGKAFVTEFAGASDTVNQSGIYSEAWNADVFVDAAPEQVINILFQGQGLGFCGGTCQFGHPLLLALLRQYLPAPQDMDEAEFWGSLAQSAELADLIDQQAWDGAAFAADFDERIIAPGLNAVELLDTWPYLTRMYTTISGAEMTVDPIFHPHPDLADVPASRVATRTYRCEEDGGGSIVLLPDGREVFLPNEDSDWPDFGDMMPWEEDVDELVEGAGAPMSVVDNTELIDVLLADYNDAAGNGGGGTGGGEGDSGSADGGGTSGGVDYPTADATGTGGAAQNGDELVGSGCACQTSRGTGGAVGFGLGLLLAGLATRRRRSASPTANP